jgi:hypothetical protein
VPDVRHDEDLLDVQGQGQNLRRWL